MKSSTLVILSRNEVNGLKALIKKIPFDKVDEYFAVDYNSTDGTLDVYKKHNIKVISQKKPGRTYAMNLAIKKSPWRQNYFF